MNTGERLILSNNHVLANSNDASPGDPIIQPGAADGGTVGADPAEVVATTYAALGNFIAEALGSNHRVAAYRPQQAANLVDAALARPLNDGDVLDEIIEVGAISGTVEALPGMPVRKSGRTTALTTGEILAIAASRWPVVCRLRYDDHLQSY